MVLKSVMVRWLNMKIVCIGNSIVNGFPHKRSQCFVSLWREASHHEIINKGVNGDTTPNVLSRFKKDVISHKPKMVLIMTGTNDYIYNICTPKETLEYINSMIKLSNENSIEPVLMTPLLIDVPMASEGWIPNINYSDINKQLIILRDLMMEYSSKNGVKIIDSQTLFSQLYTEENKSDFLHDGLHPTTLGHEAMAKFLLD